MGQWQDLDIEMLWDSVTTSKGSLTPGEPSLLSIFTFSADTCSGLFSSETNEVVVDIIMSQASEKLVGILGKDGSSNGGSSFLTVKQVFDY